MFQSRARIGQVRVEGSGRPVRGLVGCLLLSAFALIGCSADEEDFDAKQKTQDLTSAQSRVLGFEAPTQDWSATGGAAISASATATQGAAALAFKLNGSTQITSVAIVAPKLAANSAKFDIRLPQTFAWGDVRLVLRPFAQSALARRGWC